MNLIELLNKFRTLKINEAINFELMNEILISHHSSGVEGSTLTLEESRLLIIDGITAKGKPLVHHLMEKNHYEALVWTIRQAQEKTVVSPELLQKMSALVLKDTGSVIHSAAGGYDSSKGDWRKSAVHVGDRYFVNYQKVESEVFSLCKAINNKLSTVFDEEEIYKLAFDSHFYLVSIHPFADGNGRVSRLLMNFILEYKNLPWAIVFKEDKNEYFKALEHSRTDDIINLEPFRKFMFQQQEKYFTNEIKKFESELDLDILNKL